MPDYMSWSKREKEIARRVFAAAYERECRAIAGEARGMLAAARVPADLWKAHDFLGEKRRETDEKYDFRYSVLPMVFGVLLREGRISRDDLAGLSEEKISTIMRIADME